MDINRVSISPCHFIALNTIFLNISTQLVFCGPFILIYLNKSIYLQLNNLKCGFMTLLLQVFPEFLLHGAESQN